MLEQALRESEATNVLAEAAGRGFSTLVLADLGRWEEAGRLASAGSRLVEESELGWALPTLPILLALTRIEAHAGVRDAAGRVQMVSAIAQCGLPPFLVLIADVVVGQSLFDRGDLAGAADRVRSGFTCLATWPDAGILRDRLHELKERIDERRLLEPLTPAERRVLELLPTELSQREIAERLFVSQETVRTHARDIYRKLDVHTRSQAVARAREVGLLGTA